MKSPMLQEACRFRRDLPLAGIGDRAPAANMAANLVNDRRGIVLLLRRGKAQALVEHHALLDRRAFALLGLGDRRDEIGLAAGFNDLLRRLSRGIELPMPPWAVVGGVEDGVLEEGVGHGSSCRLSVVSR